MAAQIFISYSHSHIKFADKPTKRLEQSGYEVVARPHENLNRRMLEQ
jgi:hypothetical protein